MAINSYIENERKHFEVYVNGFDSSGRRVQRRKRGIETLRKAEIVEFEFKRELAKLKEEAVAYRWSEWFEECLRRMKVTQRPSTLFNYEKQLRKWAAPVWNDMELRKITTIQVHNLVYEGVDLKLTPNTRKSILKMIRRVFQMAVEVGVLDRNPCVGIQVKVPEVDSKVLTNSEAETFLREAELTDHRFFAVWFLALKTGMRSGELMALCWSDVDFDAKNDHGF